MSEAGDDRETGTMIELDPAGSIWRRVHTVAPLVVVGTREGEEINLAPKHMVTPLGWEDLFGFVCTPSHGTYQNIREEEAFTVSVPRPDDVLLASLTAAPRCGPDAPTPGLGDLAVEPARVVDGVVLKNSYLVLECELLRIVDGFNDWSLIAGRIVAARAGKDSVIASEVEGEEIVRESPLLAFLSPDRYAEIEESRKFPFPKGFKR